jgi:SPP1 gp7 family putative phage head morphogenesis protein
MSAPSGDLELVGRALDTADAVLARSLGVGVEKVAPTTPRGFERAVARLAGILRGRAAPLEQAAASAATDALAVDWRELAPRARERAVVRAAEVAREAGRALPASIRASLEKAAVGVVESVRREARLRQGLAIGVDFNAIDRRVIDHVARTQTNFVRDAFGRRCEQASARARAVVAAGLERGLGSEEIGRELGDAMRTAIEGRSPFYWEVVASSFIGDGRTYAQMSAFAEAGIETYRWLSVMDQHTTPYCRFMHGRTFSVRGALDQFDALDRLEDPEAVKDARPWVREALDRETGASALFVTKGGARVVLAEGRPSGAADGGVTYRARVSDQDLETLGASMPPAHALCRSSVATI